MIGNFKYLRYIMVLLLVMMILSPSIIYALNICDLLEKDTTITYETIYRSEMGVYREYYTVIVEDAFQSSQGMMYKLKINYLGAKTIRSEIYTLCYNIPDYIPSLTESVDKFKSSGEASVSEPIPLYNFLKPTSEKNPVTYVTIKVSLVSITDYVLNISKKSYRVKALSARGVFKDYNVHVFIDERTGLVYQMSFINRKTNMLEYEVKLAYISNIDKLVSQENKGEQETPQYLSILPLIGILVIVVLSLFMLLYIVRKVSQMLKY